jgi:hypothetical protein
MSQTQLHEPILGTTLQRPADEPGAAATNEGLLAQVHAIGDVAREAAGRCLKGKAAEEEIQKRENTFGQ